MKKTKIDWCDCTINPVIGCKNGCQYCYARKLNQRFGFIKDWEKPQFFPERLEQLKSKTPKSVFLDSMSDCGHWTIPQIKKIAQVLNENPQHNYIFLTKRPDLFIEKCKSIVEDANNGNIWVGTSITKKDDFHKNCLLPILAHRFISIEPILEDLGDLSKTDLFYYPFAPEVIIVGAETGNRKEKIIPQKEWILNIVKKVDEFNKEWNESKPNSALRKYSKPITLFMKESLREIMGADFRQDKLPWIV